MPTKGMEGVFGKQTGQGLNRRLPDTSGGWKTNSLFFLFPTTGALVFLITHVIMGSLLNSLLPAMGICTNADENCPTC